jgi:diguanylate cyclase (GGDEF)-like protein/PAS domain S-box-containing protein
MTYPMAGIPNLIQQRAGHSSREQRTRHYREIFGSIPQVLVVIDGQGNLIDVCDGAFTLVGWEAEEVIGHSVFEYLHPADHQLTALELMVEMETPHSKTQSVICRIRHADGHWMEFEAYGTNRTDDPEVGGLLLSLRDVSGRRISDRALAAGDYLYSSLSTIASDGTTIFNDDGKRAYVSASLAAMLGYTVEALLAIPTQSLVHANDHELWRTAANTAAAKENGTARTELRVVCSDGSLLWIEVTIVNLLADSGVRGVVVHARNINERRNLEERLRSQASRDPLTGIGNRYALMEQLAALSTAGSARSNNALLFCDLDGFKSINDTHGHAYGDQVLRFVASAMNSVILPTDFAARIGGDEFCIVARNVISLNYAHDLAVRVRDAVVQVSTSAFTIGVSIGVAWSASSETRSELLLNTADRAMYAAKRQGPNHIEAVAL